MKALSYFLVFVYNIGVRGIMMNQVRELIKINVSLLKLFRSSKKDELVIELIDDYLQKENQLLDSIVNIEDEQEFIGIITNYDLEEEFFDLFSGLSKKEKDLVKLRLLRSVQPFIEFEEMRENIHITYPQTKHFLSGHRIKELEQHFQEYLETKKNIHSFVLNQFGKIDFDNYSYLLSPGFSSYQELQQRDNIPHIQSNDEIRCLNHDFYSYLLSALKEKDFYDFQFFMLLLLGTLNAIPEGRRGDLQEQVSHLIGRESSHLPKVFAHLYEPILGILFRNIEKSQIKPKKSYYDSYSYEELMEFSMLYYDFEKLSESIWKYHDNEFILPRLCQEESQAISKINNPSKFIGFLHDVCDENPQKSDFELMSECNSKEPFLTQRAFNSLWLRRLEDKMWLSTDGESTLMIDSDVSFNINLDFPDLLRFVHDDAFFKAIQDFKNSEMSLEQLKVVLLGLVNERFATNGTYIPNITKITRLSQLDLQVLPFLEDVFLKKLILFRYNLLENIHMLYLTEKSSTPEEKELAKSIYDSYFAKVEAQVKGKSAAEFLVEMYKKTYESEILKKNRTKG